MNFFKTTLASFLGALFGGGILLLLLVIIISALVTPKESELELKEKTFLYMDLSDEIKERADANPFRRAGFGVPEFGDTDGLYEYRKALELAAEDEQIAGIYLRLRGVQAGWATSSSLREALLGFKESGKPIYAWSDGYDENNLHLAAVADHVHMHPEGRVALNGFAATPYFLADMFEKIGIKARVFKVGTFKSAVEPFKDNHMSDANREQITVLLTDFWDEFANQLAEVREKTDRATIEQLATSSITMVDQGAAVSSGLIDGLTYEHDLHAEMKAAIGKKENEKMELVSLSKYASANVKEEALMNSKDKIAVIFMEGSIVDGRGSNGEIGGDRFVSQIRKARLDSTVKAVVLRVNSGGGSALASDLMWAEIEAVKKEKPVICSMGDLAASGGYYIAAPADRIFAQPTTITGSIGVFSLLFDTQELMEEKMGINYDRVATHPMADIGNPNRPVTEAEAELWQSGVNSIYSRFIEVVRTGRGFPDSIAVDSIAQGRVWSGVKAKELGLVDELGGLDDAIAFAKKSAELEDYQLMMLPEPTDPWEKIAQTLGQMGIDASILGPELQEKVALYQQATSWKSGTYMIMPMDLDIR